MVASTEILAGDKSFANLFCFCGKFRRRVFYPIMSRLRVKDAVTESETVLEILMSFEDRCSSEL
jgi:hypothetical protein